MTTTPIETRPSLLERPVTSVLALSWEAILFVLLTGAALVTRFYDLGVRVMSHDESLHTQFAWYLYQGRGFQHSPLMHGVLRFEVTALTYWLFGDNDFTSRIAPALMGVIAVALMIVYRRWLGRIGALVAALLLLISPFMLYYTRYLRDEPYMVVWALLILICVLRYLETGAVRFLYWLAAISALFYATMEAAFIYNAITMLFLGLHLVRELWAARWPRPELRRPFLVAFAVALAALAVTLARIAWQRAGAGAEAVTALPADPTALATPGLLGMVEQRVELVTGVVALLAIAAGALLAVLSFGAELRRFRSLNLLMVFGLFVLPLLTAFPVLALGRNPMDYTLPAGQGLLASLNSEAGFTLLICLLLVGISAVLGWVWDWRTFLICAGIFWGIFITLFTTFFTNGGGLASGVVGSLAYWLEQHPVKRGGQPLYYYLVTNLPLYEFLPVIGALFAAGIGIWRWLGFSGPRPVAAEAAVDGEVANTITPPADPVRAGVVVAEGDGAEHALPFPLAAYFGFWAVLSIVAFSVAGEKMPWLTTHMTLPLILLSGWAIGQLIQGTDWPLLRSQRGWLVAVLLPVTLLATWMAVGSLLGANRPFQGSEMPQIQATLAFISAALVALIGWVALYVLTPPLGSEPVMRLAGLWVFAGLALLTARAAFVAAYVNYDSANEFMVYAHGARGVKTVMEQIDDISLRVEDGYGLKVAYDDDVAWPMTWYLRDYTNQAYYGDAPTRQQLDAPVVIAGPSHWRPVESILGDRYYQFEYIRMVWPMQDYFNLNAERIRAAWTNPRMRQALWNIWYARDYKLYGELTNQNFDLSEWPVSERMRLYVRKDIAAQIWPFGVGATALQPDVQPEDPYAAGRQTLSAAAAWGAEGIGNGQFQAPHGVAVGPDGSIYVADSSNHRIQKFDSAGNFVLTWGSFGNLETNTGEPGRFNDPWGVAVAPDGTVYVADTWNHRIQHFTADGQFLNMWGRFGQAETLDSLYGPRAVAVGVDGRVYVADTGNKRIVVFGPDGAGITAIGGPGSGPGELSEPVGVGVTSDGTVYVADTWNQRVQVFDFETETDEYLFVREWPVAAWYGTLPDNKPFLALDARDRVYITDPEGYRVLVFNKDGTFVTTWGDYGTDLAAFALTGAIAVDAGGNVYVTDAGNHRLMKFPPVP